MKATTTYQDWARPKNGQKTDSRAQVDRLANSTSFRGAGTAAGSSQANIQGNAQSVATLH